MIEKRKHILIPQKAWKRYINRKKAKDKRRKLRAGEFRYQMDIKRSAHKRGENYIITLTKWQPKRLRVRLPRPELPELLQYLAKLPEVFNKKSLSYPKNGILKVPKVFSLCDNCEESFDFLKMLFAALYKRNIEKVELDYANCTRIDVDAGLCMDIMLSEFITYLDKGRRRGYEIWPLSIVPVNRTPAAERFLYTVGSYNQIKGYSRKYVGVRSLNLLKSDNTSKDVWSKSELHQTKIVDYIKDCLSTMDRELSTDSEKELYQVLGETMNNAEEHSSLPFRYALGQFEENDSDNSEEHYGYFNFTILNFGHTIYDKFKKGENVDASTIKRMEELSEAYTKRGFFSKAEFEEETLWTLYALQEGVTSTGEKRGNGSIGYIDNFFKLKGDIEKDDESVLMTMSGNTRITFDGTYKILKKDHPKRKKGYKIITFNEEGDIELKPDKKYVTFVPHYFPGTLITARILIKHNNTKNDTV
jgi:hypothetical protein